MTGKGPKRGRRPIALRQPHNRFFSVAAGVVIDRELKSAFVPPSTTSFAYLVRKDDP